MCYRIMCGEIDSVASFLFYFVYLFVYLFIINPSYICIYVYFDVAMFFFCDLLEPNWLALIKFTNFLYLLLRIYLFYYCYFLGGGVENRCWCSSGRCGIVWRRARWPCCRSSSVSKWGLLIHDAATTRVLWYCPGYAKSWIVLLPGSRGWASGKNRFLFFCDDSFVFCGFFFFCRQFVLQFPLLKRFCLFCSFFFAGFTVLCQFVGKRSMFTSIILWYEP